MLVFVVINTCTQIDLSYLRQRLASDVALWTATFVHGCAVCGGVVDECIITRGKCEAPRPEAGNVRTNDEQIMYEDTHP